ncbi:MAG: DUF167 domain-containing protein [Syntrophobacteraceae bacterium]
MGTETFPFLSPKGDGTLISLHVQPKAAKNEISGILNDRLKVRICAPPVEGEANRECISFLSRVLGVAKSEITLVRGAQSRQKTFLVPRPVDFVGEKLVKAGLRA